MTTLKQFAIELPAIKDEAKRLWEDGNPCTCGTTGHAAGMVFHTDSCKISNNWRQHLTQMLLSDDPVTYIKENTPK